VSPMVTGRPNDAASHGVLFYLSTGSPQTLAGSSSAALTRLRPSGVKDKAETPLRWPRSIIRSFAPARSHSLMVWSPLPLARVWPSGEKRGCIQRPDGRGG
jgi:hypothetical protein